MQNMIKHDPDSCVKASINIENENEKKLKRMLEIEKIKNEIYRNIIEKNINIKVSDIFEEKESGFYIKQNTETDIYVNNILQTLHKVEVVEEIKPKKIKKKINKKSDIEELDDILLNKLVEQNNYNEMMFKMKVLKQTIIANTPYTKYIDMLENHYKKVYNTLLKKKVNENRIIYLMSLSYTAIDKKVLINDDFTKSEIDIDDLHKIKSSIKLDKFYDKYVVFDKVFIISKFLTYSVSLFTIKELLEITLNQPFNNLIYLPLKSSPGNDPFSFYILETITDKTRNWKMDCRLETFSNFFILNIKAHIIDLFRKMYKNVFNDNQYRRDFRDKLFIYDCEQLIQNLFVVSNFMQFNLILRKVIIKVTNSMKFTDEDIFKLTCDDKMQRNKFAAYVEDREQVIENFNQLFDNINQEQIDHLLGLFSL
jgi:hypothetical protein